MTARTTPATPISGTPITVPFWNTNARDNLLNIFDLLPEPATTNYPLVSVGVGAGSGTAQFKKVTQAGIDSVGLDADTLDGVHGSGYSTVGHSHGGGGTAGEITMWNASSASIPSGKVHYTAMVDRFPVGANNNFAFGASGGAQTHQHTGMNINHTHDIPHDHGYSGTVSGASAVATDKMQNASDANRTYAQAHDHTFSGTTGGTNTANSGGASPSAFDSPSGTHLPPYYAVTFMVQT